MKELDPETGYHYGTSYYSSNLSLWLSVDPLASERSWLTPYNFVQNNPIGRVDPDGMLDNPSGKLSNAIRKIGDFISNAFNFGRRDKVTPPKEEFSGSQQISVQPETYNREKESAEIESSMLYNPADFPTKVKELNFEINMESYGTKLMNVSILRKNLFGKYKEVDNFSNDGRLIRNVQTQNFRANRFLIPRRNEGFLIRSRVIMNGRNSDYTSPIDGQNTNLLIEISVLAPSMISGKANLILQATPARREELVRKGIIDP
ncbi:MAG: hypothetical protein J4F31_11135 [Flavobacteriales bacterium]|nr:hypothetical protein [Flavobacteriales bacterium]